jgi:pimeloyl-ACP methyl ester carboxylesterase
MHSPIRGSRLVALPGVGHSSPVQDPDGVTRATEQFLGEVKAHGVTAVDVKGDR